ncbi:MAG: sigE 1 [Akkermansiaceae bacterium]|nr:sigE 1 [Akkermansiaceae bacterium]
MPPTDATLLLSFARHRDEAAFRQLAERHFGLIFHTALRRTRDRMLAEEVTQNILSTIARKAAALLLRADRLPAWLHRATLFEASKAMRTEAARLRHARLQHPDEIPATGNASTSDAWELALPHLDDSLNALPESDRNVLVLHFFENLPFPKIASLMGKNPAAVQKQSIRALEKLSRLLRAHITALPSGAIITGLLAESAKATPFSLLPSLTTTALAATPSVSLITHLMLMATIHSKAVLAGTLLLLALPLGLQQFAIASTRAELAALSSAPPVIPSRLRPSARALPAAASPDSMLFRLSEEIITGRKVEPVRLAVDRKLAAMSSDELLQTLDQIDGVSSLGQTRSELLQRALGPLLMERDIATGMRIAVRHDWLETDWVLSAYPRWLAKDPQAVGKWLEENHDLASRPESWMRLLPYAGLFTRQILATNPPAIGGFLDHFSETQGRQVIRNALPDSYGGYLDHVPGEAEAAGWLELLRKRAPAPEDRKRMLEDFGMMCYKGSGAISLEHLDPLLKLDLPLEERRIIADAIAEEAIMGHSIPPKPDLAAKTRTWLEGFIPEEAEVIAGSAQEKVDARRDEESIRVLNYLNSTSLISDDDIARALGGASFDDHLDEALAVAARIHDPGKRAAIETELKKKP